jgi:hypothetical protein
LRIDTREVFPIRIRAEVTGAGGLSLERPAPEIFAVERRSDADREASVEAPPPDLGVRVLKPDERLLPAREQNPRLGVGQASADGGWAN